MAAVEQFPRNRDYSIIGRYAPIPAARMTAGSARVDPKPTLTAAEDGSLAALSLTAMGRLPKVLLAIR